MTGTFKEDPLSRQLDEAIRLQKEEGIVMNDKNKWTRPAGLLVGGCESKKVQENIKILR